MLSQYREVGIGPDAEIFTKNQPWSAVGVGAEKGFTHRVGDLVSVLTPRLGCLVNRVNTCDRVTPWVYCMAALMRDLGRRTLLA